jgi:ATP-dependent RNA helicase DeaD
LAVADFASMGLRSELLKMIDARGFQVPTPIQSEAIPVAMQGHDVMGQAQTGTGKTASFGLPILNQVVKGGGLQALIVAPTRELAVQIREEIASLGMRIKVHILAVYGGQSIELQLRALGKKPEIVVGTPGRLLDHLRRGTIDLKGIRFLVLDEADKMLDMGFLPDIEDIVEKCPQERQTFLFSATLDMEIRNLGRRFMIDPVEVLIEAPEKTISVLEQKYYLVDSRHKMEQLCRIIAAEKPASALVFCRTKKGTGELAGMLKNRSYNVEAIHGDLSQRERDMVMSSYRQGQVAILVATDIAARGLDIENITHVINYDIPDDPDTYVHRVGRTGRAGRTGIAITLMEPWQDQQIRAIERYIGKRITRCTLPSSDVAVRCNQDKIEEQLLKMMHPPLGAYREIADQLLDKYQASLVLAAALRLVQEGGGASLEIKAQEPVFEEQEMAHLEISLGRMHGMTPPRLVKILVDSTSLRADQIGDIDIQRSTSYIEIPMQAVDEVYQAVEHYRKGRRTRSPRVKDFPSSRDS